MDPAQRERVRDDLKGVVRGELLFTEFSRVLYSTDASLFEVLPIGAVVPRDEADVQALVRYAAEHHVPLVARGAGSGLAGESLGGGLVVDLSKHFREVVEVGADFVRVQPGVVYRDLAARLAREGRRFAPDPSHVECTLGGMLATDASGSRCFRHGYTRDHVDSLRAVLDSGDVAVLARHARFATAETPHGRLEDIVSSVWALLQENEQIIAECHPRTRFNRCGYLLHDVRRGDELDLARTVVGSEGTLGLFTEATLRTIPLPGGRSLVLLGFASLDEALRASRALLPTDPTACDLVDRRLLTLARGSSPELAALIPAAVEAVLLVEYETDTPAAAQAAAEDALARFTRGAPRALLAEAALDDERMGLFWQVRESALPGLFSLRGAVQPLAFVEDVGVPVEALPLYLHRVQELLHQHETTASYLIHAASGQVHMRPFLDPRRREDAARLWTIADEVYQIVLELGGTISTQHGTGLARTPWVARQYGALFPVFRKLKAIFDPQHLFNPGKITGPAPDMPAWPLRRSLPSAAPAPAPAPTANGEAPAPRRFALSWRDDEAAQEVHSCNGCGSCRTDRPDQRMCPVFRADRGEAAAPRAKPNLMRHLLHGDTDPRAWAADEARAVADLCVHCKSCVRECPSRVNAHKLMLEVKAAHVAEHGLDRSDWVMSRTEQFARLGSALAPLANAFLGSPAARWLLERLFGVSRHRRLHTFAPRSFLRQARGRGWTRKPRSARPRVAYFVDVFANYNDPSVAEAAVAVLHHNGIEVYVPPRQRGCGMAPLTYGDVETAREAVQTNLRALADLAREGYPILCSEPTAAVMLRQDALDLLDDPDARLVAAQTVELTAYLWDLHQDGRLRTDFQALDFPVGHHVPCHVKALGRPAAGPALLGLIPGLRVRTVDVGCSGMAGTFGLKAENYSLSLEAGRPMLDELRHPRVLFGSAECSACRLQITDGAGKRALHPVQYLALGYGLLPELSKRLRQPLGRLVIS